MRRLLLILLVALLAAVPAVGPARADDEVDQKQEELQRNQQEQEARQAELESLHATDEQLAATLEEANRKVAAQQAAVDAAAARVNDAKARVANAVARISATEAEIAERKKVVAARAVAAYKNPGARGLEAILGSQDVTEAVDRAEMLDKLFAHDREVLEALKVLQSDLSAQRRELAAASQEAERARVKAADELNSLEGLRGEAEVAKAQVDARIAEVAAEVDALLAVQAQIESDIAARREELRGIAEAAGINFFALEPSAAGFVSPTSGVLTSGFGERWGRLHAGIDIAADTGTDIVAAARGIVIAAEWYGGYGNAVILDHGGGLLTLYGHFDSLAVAQADIVEQGQYLGAMGSTGNSTGPHLHFEVRLDDEPTDPMPWLP